MKKAFSIILIMLLLSGLLYPVHAQEVKKPKLEKTAMLLSLGATAIPIPIAMLIGSSTGHYVGHGLAMFSVIVGPSVGHFYAGQIRRGMSTMGLRIGIGIGTVASLLLIGINDMDEDKGMQVAAIGFLIGGGLIVGSAVYDIFTAPRSVRKYNESIDKIGNVYFVPKIDLKEENYGLSLVYCF